MSINVVPAGRPDVLGLLGQVEVLLGEVNAAPLWPVPGAGVLEVARAAQRVAAKVAAVGLRAVAEAESRGAAVEAGAASTAGWLRGVCGLRPGAARAQVALAEALTRRYPATLEALAAGAVSAEAARVVSVSLDALPSLVDVATVRRRRRACWAGPGIWIPGGWPGWGPTCARCWTRTAPTRSRRRRPPGTTGGTFG